MTISMHKLSVGVFIHFLGNLSDLLDRATAYAGERKIDPAILLNSRLYPNMYNLARQVGEANRHALIACALMTDMEPPVFPDTEPDIPELKARSATAIAFMQGLRPAQIDGATKKRRLHVSKWLDAKIHGSIVAAYVQRSAVLFSPHHGLRHPAPLRRRTRQERFSGSSQSNAGRLTGFIFRRRLCERSEWRRLVQPFRA
jgi:Domain of unknown function (DUF1993)